MNRKLGKALLCLAIITISVVQFSCSDDDDDDYNYHEVDSFTYTSYDGRIDWYFKDTIIYNASEVYKFLNDHRFKPEEDVYQRLINRTKNCSLICCHRYNPLCFRGMKYDANDSTLTIGIYPTAYQTNITPTTIFIKISPMLPKGTKLIVK